MQILTTKKGKYRYFLFFIAGLFEQSRNKVREALIN